MKKVGIGLRVQPNQITFAVIEETDDAKNIKVVDKLNVPKALNRPDQLKFIRSTMLDILDENQAQLACIRLTEPSAQNFDIDRISIEAIIQELIASSEVVNYCVGHIASISSKLGFERDQFKNYVEKNVVYDDIENWPKFSKYEREALLSAFCSLTLSI